MSPVKLRLVCTDCEHITRIKVEIPELEDWNVLQVIGVWGICPDCLKDIQEDHIGKVEELNE